MTSKEKFEVLSKDFSSKTSTEIRRLEDVYRDYSCGLINTDMNIQRSYVWTSEQQQELFDSLLIGMRIPEFHSLSEPDEQTADMADGKQRLTTIVKILENQIPLIKSNDYPHLQFLFDERKKTQLMFQELPEFLQNRVKHTKLTITNYAGLNDSEKRMLFSKINNGSKLSEFASSIAKHIDIRLQCSHFLLKHNAIKKSTFALQKDQDKVELMLIRAVILRALGKESNLAPVNLENNYKKLEAQPELLIKARTELLEALNRTECLHIILSCRSWETISPFILDFICDHPEMTKEQIATFVADACSYKAGRGNDLNGFKGNKDRMDFLKKVWKNISKT